MFENKIYEGIHYSRFVASWYNAGGESINGVERVNRRGEPTKLVRGREVFKNWLRTLTINDKPIPEEVINEIAEFGANGKLELETSARAFLYEREAE